MYLLSKEDLKRQIGTRPLFKRLPRTEAVLKYVSGIQELKNPGEPLDSFFIRRYPKGILIADRKRKYRIGIPFNDLKNVTVTRKDDDYEVTFTSSLTNPVAFSFRAKDRLRTLPFIKLLPHREEGDPRDEETVRTAILQLKEEFTSTFFTERTFHELLRSVTKNDAYLEINKHQVRYGKSVLNTADIKGYSVQIGESQHGIVSGYEYRVWIYHPEENLFITFSSVSVQFDAKYAQLLDQISAVLFDLVGRRIVSRWFDLFAKGETLEHKHFSLSRQGIRLKSDSPGLLMHWDEIVAQNTGMFRWPYNNTIFQRIDGSDQNGPLLFFLIKWLREDPERLKALMGRTYYVS